MKSKAEKTHATKPSVQRQADRSNGRSGGPFIPPSVQTKLTINTPGDALEQEADAMADRVVGTQAQPMRQEPQGLRLQPEAEEEEMLQRQEEEEEEMLQRQAEEEEEEIQRQCAECEEEDDGMIQRQEAEEEEEIQRQEEEEEELLQRQPEAEEEEMLQRQEEEEMLQRQPEAEEEELQRQCADCEEEEELQRSETSSGGGKATAPPIVNNVVSGGGDTMESGTRTFMENRFGTDFSSVRIHNDSRAHESAKSISAQAYTYGSHVVFAKGKYEPHTAGGQHLLAHELTHVVQQGKDVRRRAANDSDPNPAPVLPQTEGPEVIGPEAEAAPGSTPSPGLPTEDLPDAEVAAGTPAPEELLEPLMPPPPEELGPNARGRMRQAQQNAGTAAENNATLPTSDESTQEAREGATEPTEETSARASGALTASLSERPAPSPEIEELCENIRRVIRDKRPPDEDSLLNADPEEAANEAGTQLNDNVESDVDRVEGQYDELDDNPAGEAEQIGEEMEMPPESVDSPAINADGAAPDALSEEEVSLEADVEASATQMEDAGMSTEVADVIQDGPVAEARSVHGELEQTAAEDPALVLAEQDAALGSARDDMESLQAQALAALEASRSGTVTEGGTQQVNMVGSEEEQRQALGTAAENIFTAAQDQVNLLLEPLTDTAMQMWETGKDRIATEFEQHLARVQSWVDERHSGFGGGVTELWDDLTGLPGWVTDEYDDAERDFGDSICDLIREISTYVNGVILTCEELIDNANTEIDELFANAPEELQEWAAEQREVFQGRLDGLREQVSNTQQSFNEDLANRAAQAVQEVREQVHALREAAKGLLGQIADAIADFLEDPVRAIINGLLSLVGIEPAAFWALVNRIEQVISDIADDPLGFASNLLSAIGAGFQKFFDNILTHLFEGFIEWLFSGLGAVGVEIPSDFSLGSIITFFLQLMGITWDRIRELMAKHIGEENVALLEQAYEIISDLIELGPAGVFELIKDQLDPRHILDTIINMAIDFVVETLITQATIRIIALFNPVGAIAQAIEAIYKVLKWIFENAARIFTFVETVVNGIADIVAGNIAGMATAVENALAQLLVPVIDFIAEFMSLGDLPDKVADAVRGLQEWVEGILDRVIGWLADQAKSILSALGITEDEDPEEAEEAAEELDDTEVGDEATFTALGERHRLWVDSSGSRVKVMMASATQPVEDVLQDLQETEDNGLEEDAPERVDEAQQQLSLFTVQAQETADLIEEATDDEQPVLEEVDAAQEADEETESMQLELAFDVGEAIEAASEPPLPTSAIFNPAFGASPHPAQHLEAREVVEGNHPAGSSPSKTAIPEAWDIIKQFGLNVGSTWVRFHIFNDNIGGKGVNSNLIPTPRFINTNYLNTFETTLKNYHDDGTPVWFLGTVNYFSDNPWFVEDYRAVGGGMKYESGEWVEDPDKDIPEYDAVPGVPEPELLDINSILMDDELTWNIVSNLTPLSRNIMLTLQDHMPEGGYRNLGQIELILHGVLSDSSYKTQIMNALGKLNIVYN